MDIPENVKRFLARYIHSVDIVRHTKTGRSYGYHPSTEELAVEVNALAHWHRAYPAAVTALILSNSSESQEG